MKFSLAVMVLCLGLVFSAHAQETIRVDDVRLHHPFKAGVLKGATFGYYNFTRTEIEQLTPDNAELPIGFEQYVREHGAIAYYSAMIIGFTWSMLVFSFLAYGVFYRVSSLLATPINKGI